MPADDVWWQAMLCDAIKCINQAFTKGRLVVDILDKTFSTEHPAQDQLLTMLVLATVARRRGLVLEILYEVWYLFPTEDAVQLLSLPAEGKLVVEIVYWIICHVDSKLR